MGNIDKEWHAEHRMAPKANEEQRGQWHSEHFEACGCRTPSEKEQALIEAYREAPDR